MEAIRKVELGGDSVPAPWSPLDAVKELIANAFDEAAQSATGAPEVRQLYPGCWELRDHGRGLVLEMLLSQLPSTKAEGAGLAAHRGTGLVDALQTLARAGATVLIRTGRTDLVVPPLEGGRPRALVLPASEPGFRGTSLVIDGIPDRVVRAARDGFLALRPLRLVESTPLGDVLAAEPGGGEVFVDGILAFADPSLPLSFDLRGLPAAMKRAVLRPGSTVTRTFCLDRVRRIMARARAPELALLDPEAADRFSLAA